METPFKRDDAIAAARKLRDTWPRAEADALLGLPANEVALILEAVLVCDARPVDEVTLEPIEDPRPAVFERVPPPLVLQGSVPAPLAGILRDLGSDRVPELDELVGQLDLELAGGPPKFELEPRDRPRDELSTERLLELLR